MVRFNSALFRSVPVLLSAGAIILFSTVLGALYLADRAADESESAVRASQLNLRVLRLFSAVQDAETGQRGYLVTGEERYLEPFNRSLSSISSETQILAPQLRDLGLPQSEIDELQNLLKQKLAEIVRTIELQRSGDSAGAVALVKSSLGANFMDRIRAIIEQIQQLGISNSAAHITTLRTTMRWLTGIVAGSAALLLVLAGGVLKVMFDRTRQIERARRKLVRINETLEETVAQRTESLQLANNELQSYAYIVGHDLRAPLVNIMGFTEELDRASGIFRSYLNATRASTADANSKAAIEAVETDIPEALGFIRSSMRRMDNLINQILVIARAGNRELNPESLRLNDLMDETLATVRHRLDENNIAIEMDRQLPEVRSDRLALQQIIGNLLDNAIKYMDPARTGKIGIRGWRKGALAVFEISDNGRGIAEGDQERIFELFRRSGKQDTVGEGVGLAHVRTLVRRLGGDVSLLSVLGKGTTFQVTIAADLSKIGEESKE